MPGSRAPPARHQRAARRDLRRRTGENRQILHPIQTLRHRPKRRRPPTQSQPNPQRPVQSESQWRRRGWGRSSVRTRSHAGRADERHLDGEKREKSKSGVDDVFRLGAPTSARHRRTRIHQEIRFVFARSSLRDAFYALLSLILCSAIFDFVLRYL